MRQKDNIIDFLKSPLARLSRRELIEMVRKIRNRCKRIEKENEAYKEKIAELEATLSACQKISITSQEKIW